MGTSSLPPPCVTPSTHEMATFTSLYARAVRLREVRKLVQGQKSRRLQGQSSHILIANSKLSNLHSPASFMPSRTPGGGRHWPMRHLEMLDPGSRSGQVQDPREQTQWQEKAIQLVGHWSLVQAGRGRSGFAKMPSRKMHAILETESGDIK